MGFYSRINYRFFILFEGQMKSIKDNLRDSHFEYLHLYIKSINYDAGKILSDFLWNASPDSFDMWNIVWDSIYVKIHNKRI